MVEKNKLDLITLTKTAESFKKNFFDVHICENKNEALKKLLSIINTVDCIGYGGSRTLEEIGFFEKFTKEKYPNLLDRKKTDITQEEKNIIQHKALTSDVFLSSANAVSEDGQLILIDKWGNRNAGVTFGPKKRIFVIGKNKISPDFHSAVNRAKNTASVLNNIRFETKNPCTKTGKCMDCSSTDRLCSVTTIIHKCQPPASIIILLINEDLGF